MDNSLASIQQDIYGEALMDYFSGVFKGPLILHNSYGEPEEMPVEVFFRDEADLSELEQYALHLCQGRVLDVGAGAGVHSLLLQNINNVNQVVALERSEKACQVMQQRQVRHIENKNVFEYVPSHVFDNILLLMNGTGIFGTVDNFCNSLQQMKRLLSNSGKIIIDSSDISYLYEGTPQGSVYRGEVQYQYEYRGCRGEWFPWLYLDQVKLMELSHRAGFRVQILYENDEDQYLAALQPLH